MKLHVVFNKDGDILAAAHLDSNAPVRLRPIADEKAGHRAAEVYVPTEYQRYDLAGVCRQMKVDNKAKLPGLTAKE